MHSFPAGTVTFLLTDIENSAMTWESAPESMKAALELHDRVITDCVATHRGAIVKHLGDGCWAAFDSASAAADAAIDCQRQLQATDQAPPVRIGLHTGEVNPTGNDYFGPVPNRSARITDLANGNQIVCSSATASLLHDIDLHSQGRHVLRGIGTDEVFVIRAPGVYSDDRPLRRPVPPSNLPARRDSFLGRDDDLEELDQFLEEPHSVVTILGPGGVGKTRLAVHAAEHHAGRDVMSVVFCDLGPVGDGSAVAATVADLIGARQQPGMDLVDSIVDYVAGVELLLILDTCEHLIDDVSQLIERLAPASRMRILATSREALNVPGEQLFTLAPLPVETHGVDLFVDRARQRDPRFELGPSNSDSVRAIVRELDGIPLAIELAAARIRLMTPAEIAARLDDRFRLLRGGRGRTRHETLRAAVSWSFKLLTEDEAAVFARLSVFAGGFGLTAAEQVCGDADLEVDVADAVMALVDKSMIVSRARDGVRWFTMLETLRQYGEEQLVDSGEAGIYRHRHADYYRALAVTENERLFSPFEAEAWRVLDREWSNLRAALDTFEDIGDDGGGAELVLPLIWYGTMAMRYEVFTWAQELLDRPGSESSPAYTDLCGAAAIGAYLTLHGDVSVLANAGLAHDPTDPMSFCRMALAAIFLNNLHSAADSDQLTEDFLASNPQTIGGRIWAHGFRTFHLCLHEDGRGADRHAAECVAIAEHTGSATARGIAAWAQGQVESFDDIQGAVDLWTEGLEWPRSLNSSHLLEHLLTGLLLHFAARRGALPDVLKRCRDAVDAALDQHYYAGVSHLFGVTAIVLARSGDPATGAALLGAMGGNGHQPRSNAVRALTDALGDDFEGQAATGSHLSVTGAGRMALEALDVQIGRHGFG